jgi:hypothetical protein
MTADKTPAAEPARSAPEGAQERPIWKTATVALDHPVSVPDGPEIASLTFSEPDVEVLERIEELDLAEGQKIKVRHLRVIAAALSRQPDDVIRALHARDFGKVVEAIAPFLEYLVRKEEPSS